MIAARFAICAVIGLVAAQNALAAEDGQYKAALSGYNATLPVSTTGTGEAVATVAADQKSLKIVLKYTKLEGSGPVAQLVFGQIGNIVAFVCGGGTKPACPATGGEVTATIEASDVLDTAKGQGIAAKDLPGVLRALDNGAIYINVVTDKFLGGEIRGQFTRGFGMGQNDDRQGPPADNPGEGHGKGHDK